MTETVWPVKLKTFTICPFKKSLSTLALEEYIFRGPTCIALLGCYGGNKNDYDTVTVSNNTKLMSINHECLSLKKEHFAGVTLL